MMGLTEKGETTPIVAKTNPNAANDGNHTNYKHGLKHPAMEIGEMGTQP